MNVDLFHCLHLFSYYIGCSRAPQCQCVLQAFGPYDDGESRIERTSVHNGTPQHEWVGDAVDERPRPPSADFFQNFALAPIPEEDRMAVGRSSPDGLRMTRGVSIMVMTAAARKVWKSLLVIRFRLAPWRRSTKLNSPTCATPSPTSTEVRRGKPITTTEVIPETSLAARMAAAMPATSIHSVRANARLNSIPMEMKKRLLKLSLNGRISERI